MQKPLVVKLPKVVSDEIVDPQETQTEIASLSAVRKQPNMETDSGDACYAFSNTQTAPSPVVGPQETQTETLLSELVLLVLATSSGEFQNSSNHIHKELINTLSCQLHKMINVVKVSEQKLDMQKLDISVKLWLFNVMEVLTDMEDILDEIMDANISRLRANKPWKLSPNLFNKVSRFLPCYRDREMASKVMDITVRLKHILDEARELGLGCRLTTGDPKNHGSLQHAMLNAINKGKFWKVRHFFENNSDAIFRIFENGQTALHVAITAGQLRIAKELITGTSMANRHLLKIQDGNGKTALSFAALCGMMEIAKCLIERNKDLLTIPDANNKIPVQLACSAGHEDMTRYLYCETPQKFLDGDYGFHLLEECITRKMFDIALHLLHCFPKFAIYRFFEDSSIPIISTLAQTPPPFFRGNQLASWRRWIYKCITVKVDKKNILSGGVGIVAARQSGTLVSILLKFLAKQIYDLKLMDAIAHEVIHFTCQSLSALDENQFERSGALEATFQAIKNGIPDIVIEFTKVNAHIIWNITDPEDSRNTFACAVAHRQEEVAQFLYGFNARIGTNIVFTTDKDGNNLLHLAAKLAPRSQLDSISGAALRMQSELRWFKEVESIVPQFYNDQKNKNGDGETPYQVFVKEHKQLLKEAEEWLKKTAESFTIIGALIVTIMFAASFTVPDGNYQNTGFPIFLNKTADSSKGSSPTLQFMVFVASDAISLIAASASVLSFLGILTSRYAYKDFLKSLPVRLIIGISSLLISITAMMVAFCVALFIMLKRRLWIIIPVTLLAGIPVVMFVLLLFPFLVELYNLTFRPGIFDEKNINIEKGRDG